MNNADTMKEQGITLYNQHDYEAAARAFQQAKDAYSDNDQYDMVALENRTDLNFRQRIIKNLSNLVARLSGAKPAYRLSSSW
jgi:hypothetical protein